MTRKEKEIKLEAINPWGAAQRGNLPESVLDEILERHENSPHTKALRRDR